MRALRATLVASCALACACGGDAATPGVSIALTADDTHPCAGAVRLVVTVSEVNGASRAEELDAAVAPEQFECDFSVGVAEAIYAAPVGEIDPGRPHVVKVELFDSTGLNLAVGATDVFQARADTAIEPVTLQLTRLVPVGTLLVDLYAEPTVRTTGTLAMELLGGSDVLGTRELAWPGDESLKRPLRLSGLPQLSGLQVVFTLQAGGTTVASFITEPFSIGTTAADAFANPELTVR